MTSLGVLHLLAPAPFGGLELVVRQLARGQLAAGADVRVAAVVQPHQDEHPFVAKAREDGLNIHVIRARTRDYLGERRAVETLLRDAPTHVLHTHGYRPDVVDAPVARQLGVATVSTAHGFVGNTARGRFYEWLQRRALRRCDAVVAVSARLQAELVAAGVAPHRVYVIPNAPHRGPPPRSRAEAKRHLGLPSEGPPTVGWVGRVGPEKGPEVFVRALQHAELKGVHACVVGDGSAVSSTRALAESLGVSSRIQWCGQVSDAGRYMRAFDVLCLSSHTEGTPIVLFEAEAAGLPVIATDVGGVAQVLGRGWNVVPARDDHALAVALARAIESPDQALEALQRARERIARDFDSDRWVQQHLALYREVAL